MTNLTPDNPWRWTLLKALYLFLPMAALTFALGTWPLMRAGRAEQSNRALEDRVKQLEAIVAKLKLDKVTSVDSNPNNGHLQMGNLLICWGRSELKMVDELPHTKDFNFVFPVEFADPPAVMTGFHLQTEGRVYGVYNSSRTTAGFSGGVFDNKSGQADATPALRNTPVTMSYLAIGKPKSPSPKTGD